MQKVSSYKHVTHQATITRHFRRTTHKRKHWTSDECAKKRANALSEGVLRHFRALYKSLPEPLSRPSRLSSDTSFQPLKNNNQKKRKHVIVPAPRTSRKRVLKRCGARRSINTRLNPRRLDSPSTLTKAGRRRTRRKRRKRSQRNRWKPSRVYSQKTETGKRACQAQADAPKRASDLFAKLERDKQANAEQHVADPQKQLAAAGCCRERQDA